MKKIILIIILFCSINIFSQWTQINLTTTSGLNNAFFVDENVGYIVGGGDIYGYPNNTNGIILKTIDGGNTWETIFSQNQISLNHIFIINNKIYAYGKDSLSQSLLVFSDDNGANWTNSTPNFNTDKMQFSNNIIYFIDNEGSNTLLKKIENNNITTIANGIGVFGVNGNEIIYVNQSFDTIYKSTDYGQNWVQLSGYPSGFGNNQSVFSVIKPFNNKIVIHYTYPNNIAYSNDNGVNWTEILDDSFTSKTTIINNNTIYSIAQTNISATNNFTNWNTQLEANNQKRAIYFYNDNLGFVLGDNGLLYKTSNGGGLSVNDTILEKKIKIFPIPTKGTIKIEIAENISIENIHLIDSDGKLIKSFHSNFNKLKTCNITKGNYILKIITDKGILTKKVVID